MPGFFINRNENIFVIYMKNAQAYFEYKYCPGFFWPKFNSDCGQISPHPHAEYNFQGNVIIGLKKPKQLLSNFVHAC